MAGPEYTTEQEQATATPGGAARMPQDSSWSASRCLRPMLWIPRLPASPPLFPATAVQVVVPEGANTGMRELGSLTLLPYTPAVTSATPWILTASDYFNRV